MYDRLLEEVINSGSAYTMDRYEKILKRTYPDRMRSAYEFEQTYIKNKKRGNQAMIKLMKYLKKIASYPQGAKAAGQLAQEWRTLYKRRRAMMDELMKAGF